MPARIIEAMVFTSFTLLVVMFIFSAGLMSAPVVKESQLQRELEAKQLYLALDNVPARNTTAIPPGTSVIDLLRQYYSSGDDQYMEMAEDDIRYYSGLLIDDESVWRVYTADGNLDVRSSFFADARARGSSTVSLLEKTDLVVVVGTL